MLHLTRYFRASTAKLQLFNIDVEPNGKTSPRIEYYRLPENSVPKITEVERQSFLHHYKELETMRKMEINCDQLYKDKKIRGFCHLYDGQESIAEGMEAALTFDDPLITAYRVHCQAYKRGYSIRQIMAEMFGKVNGATKGKGGSMHYYKKSTNFYGGNGIVGAQIPVGAGLAFALKYEGKKNISCTMFGDGAANQGQLYEAANMAYIWKLPCLFIIENNLYGMGTSAERISMNPLFYTRGDRIPGIRTAGNNFYEIREVMKFAKNYVIQNGPLYLEFITYRYHGHSMSDPGISYRDRIEIQEYRKQKDPIKVMRAIGKHLQIATVDEMDKIEQEQSDFVREQINLAMNDPQNDPSKLIEHVYVDNDKHFIRGKLYEESFFPVGQEY